MSAPNDSIRIAQLSDTHFLADSDDAEGGFAYDTSAAFDAVCDHLKQQAAPDLVVVTGDVADHGTPAQYRRAATAFAQLELPVNVCPGNHDQDMAFATGMARPTIGTSRVMEIGAWCFVFVDSNAGVMVPDERGRRVDPATYEDRLHANGALGPNESSWVRDVCSTTEAEHVFVWLHHPPEAPVGLTRDDNYAAEWRELAAQLPTLRGFGGGHTHIPDDYRFDGHPVFVCPSLKNNFDLTASTLLPPGYRTYEFGNDGSVTSSVQLVDDPRWPRSRFGRSVMALLNGEITWDQFDEIVARRRNR